MTIFWCYQGPSGTEWHPRLMPFATKTSPKMTSSACIPSIWCVFSNFQKGLIWSSVRPKSKRQDSENPEKPDPCAAKLFAVGSAGALYGSVYNSKLQVSDGGCYVLLQVGCNAMTNYLLLLGFSSKTRLFHLHPSCRYIQKDTRWRNKQRSLVFCSRGVTARQGWNCRIPSHGSHRVVCAEVSTSVRWYSEDDASPQNSHAFPALLKVERCWKSPDGRVLCMARNLNLRNDPISRRLMRQMVACFTSFTETCWCVNVLCLHPAYSQQLQRVTPDMDTVFRSASWRTATMWFSLKLENEKTCDLWH